jgi:hypothetical protein
VVFTCVVALSAVPLGVAQATTSNFRGGTAKICRVTSECPTIVAVAKPTSSHHEISRFLTQLWAVNFDGGRAGTYQLQRCEDPGSAPYRVECVLFTTGTPQDLDALREVFVSSRLFASVSSST